MAADEDDVLHYLADLRPSPPPPQSYTEYRGTRCPLVIDSGAWECRAGWAGEAGPRLRHRNVLAKTRREKGKESELLIGSDIVNIEALRHALKSPFDRNIVTHYETAERLLDYSFSHLGMDTEVSVPHPVLMIEALAQPNTTRHLSSQLLFELYGVPSVSYGLESLFSLSFNQPDIRDALVITLGHQTIHVVPWVGGVAVHDQARRLNLGGAHLAHYLQRVLQLKYPNHVASLTLSRAEEMLSTHTRLVPHFFEELRQWRDPDHYDSHVRKIQLPFTPTPRATPVDQETLKSKRQELARRLVEINARKRDERLVVDEANLRQMLIVKDIYQQGYEMKFSKSLAKLNMGLGDIHHLEIMIEKVKSKIEKARESKVRESSKEEKVEPDIKKKREEMDDGEKQEFDSWLLDIREKFNELKEKKLARSQRRQQLAKRRTAASQERMRIISQLARNTKKDDNFGMRDEDWDVYKQISKEGGDSDSEEEGLRCAEYEAILREHEPQEEEVGRDSAEWHQIHLATETIRAPELIFQPSMVGQDQAGLGELVQFVLARFSPGVAEQLANNIFLTGGLANISGLQERLETELRCMRPAGSTFRVSVAKDPSLDCWRGASQWAASSEAAFLSREQYLEEGEGYLLEHSLSNRYFATPLLQETGLSSPSTPLVREFLPNPSTLDCSSPSSPQMRTEEELTN